MVIIIMYYLSSIDQSTTSTKFSVFTPDGVTVAKEIIEHKQICVADGFLEHDPQEIIRNLYDCIDRVISKLKQDSSFDISQIKGVGVTNQRETTICWNKDGKPYYNAIVWCDTRCKEECEWFKSKYGELKNKTGLPVSTYFSLFKILWLINHVPSVKEAIERDDIFFGTIDTWVIYNLTGQYVTDASNASRTYLCNLNGQWDDQLIQYAGIKKISLPTIVDSFTNVGKIKKTGLAGVEIGSILGDQQSSAFAHELKQNQIKITYGTGCCLLASIGKEPIIHNSFITTILHKNKGVIEYAFECSVECGGGTLNWARRAGFFNQYQELNYFAPNSQEIYFFPSFGEIYAPFWKSNVKGGISGLNFSTKKTDIISALLESIIFRVNDNIKSPSFSKVNKIYADGGMTVNKAFMQAQASIFNKMIIVRQRDTCWGVAKGVLVNLEIEQINFKDEHSSIYEGEQLKIASMRQKYEKWCVQRHRFYGW